MELRCKQSSGETIIIINVENLLNRTLQRGNDVGVIPSLRKQGGIMLIEKQDKDKLQLQYRDGMPVLEMESEKVKLTMKFAEKEDIKDTKQVVVDILTNQCGKKQ